MAPRLMTGNATDAGEALPERITDADLAILSPFWERIRQARRTIDEAENALAVIGGVLTPRYRIGPHDVVEEDGSIDRGKLLREPLTPHIPDRQPGPRVGDGEPVPLLVPDPVCQDGDADGEAEGI